MTSTGVPSRTDRAVNDAGSSSHGRPVSPEQIRDELVDRAAETAQDIADLVRLYYRYMPPEEVIDDDPVDLLGAVRSHRALAERRVPGRPAVRVINPTVAADGWSTHGTVVQIVTDDMPYLVESVSAELVRSGVQVQRVAHPIVVVRRDVTGQLREVLPAADPADPPAEAFAESWMSIEVDLVTDPDRGRDIETGLHSVLTDVREVVEDTDKMVGTALSLAESLTADPPPLEKVQVDDGADLLRWLAGDHFTFLGYRYYELVTTDENGSGGSEQALRAALASGLGVLRKDSLAARSLTAGPDATAYALSSNLLVLTEASAPSTVHRSVYPYYVGVKTFDEKGRSPASTASSACSPRTRLHEDVLDIPVVERRVREVIHRAGLPAAVLLGPADARGDPELAERGTLLHRPGFVVQHDDRRDRVERPQAPAPVPAQGPLRPLLLVPGVPAARPVHDDVAPGDAGGARRRTRRHQPRIQHARRRNRSRAGALHRARRPERAGRARRSSGSRSGSPRPCAAGTTGWSRRSSASSAMAVPPRSWAPSRPPSRASASPPCSPRRTRRTSPPRTRWPTCAACRACSARATWRCRSTSRRTPSPASAGSSSTWPVRASRSRTCCRCCSRWAWTSSTSGPTSCAATTAPSGGSTTSG